MKIELLKNIIRESVREAVREELRELLSELVKPTPTNTHKKPSNSSESIVEKGNTDPLSEMISMTKSSMNPTDYRNILETGYRPDFSQISFNSQDINNTASTYTGPQTGLDISKLDFVKNAANIYNKSVEKDKARLG